MGVALPSLRGLLLENGEDIWRDEMCAVRDFPVDTRANVRGVGLCVAKVQECLIQSVWCVSRAQLFEEIESMANNTLENLAKVVLQHIIQHATTVFA